MILWFDKDFEPQTTEDTAWAVTTEEAALSVVLGMFFDYIDTDDIEEATNFFQWLDFHGMLKYVKQVNIHGTNILNQENKKKICEFCNKNNVPVTFNLPDLTKLKKANVGPDRLGGNTYDLQSCPLD